MGVAAALSDIQAIDQRPVLSLLKRGISPSWGGGREEKPAKSSTWIQALLLLQQSTGRVRLGRA
jgi:hypothetical protein